jgi:hypothetical protein
MPIKEKIELVLDTKGFEKGLTRARRRFGTFAERTRNMLGGGRTGAGSRGRQRGGLIEGLTRGGGALSAVAGGFGATAAVAGITRSIQGVFDQRAQLARNVALRGAGPAGTRGNELAQMAAQATKARKAIFGMGDAMTGIALRLFGTQNELDEWNRGLRESVNVTRDHAEGMKILSAQEQHRRTVATQRGIDLVRAGQKQGLVTPGFTGQEGQLIRAIEGMKSAAEAIRFTNNLQANLDAGRPLTTPAGAINAAEANYFGWQ